MRIACFNESACLDKSAARISVIREISTVDNSGARSHRVRHAAGSDAANNLDYLRNPNKPALIASVGSAINQGITRKLVDVAKGNAVSNSARAVNGVQLFAMTGLPASEQF